MSVSPQSDKNEIFRVLKRKCSFDTLSREIDDFIMSHLSASEESLDQNTIRIIDEYDWTFDDYNKECQRRL
jgi:hypothetical protein